MPAKRGGVRTRPVVVEPEPEPEAQALIQEQIDTTDVDGAFLRGLLVDITNEEDVALAELKEEERVASAARQKVIDELRNINREAKNARKRGDAEKESELHKLYSEKYQIYNKLDEHRDEINKRLQLAREPYVTKHRGLFFVAPENQIEVKLNITAGLQKKTTVMDLINPQLEFLQKIWSGKAGQVKYDIKVEASAGGGGTSHTGQKRISLGTKNMVDTTPIHEFAHQVEEQTPGLRKKRAERAKEIVLKYTGKQKIEDVELEKHIHYIDTSGKEHYRKVGGKDVYVPKGIFKTREEQAKYGYVFRVYSEDIQSRFTHKRIKSNVGDRFGVEMTSETTEHIYDGPKEFAERFPEVFDMVVDLYRGKL